MAEENKVNMAELQKQLEYYLSDKNLKTDEFFHNIIKNSETKSVPVEKFLNCNKIKKLGATADDIVNAAKASTDVEVLADNSALKRKNDTLPELVPKNQSKNDTAEENKNGDGNGFMEHIFMISLPENEGKVKWDVIQSEVEKAYGIKVAYSRLNKTEGHFAVDQKELTEETKNKMIEGGLQVGEINATIKDCTGDDLKAFYNDHGHHLNSCLERVGLKKKKKGKKGDKEKGQEDFIFMNQRYNNLAKLRGIFRNMIQQSGDGEIFKDAEHTMLHELLKFHESYESKIKGLKHFTVGPHPEYKSTRCFFVVRDDDTKEDFSFQKCLDAIKKKFNLTD